jgi:shikimate dehydrogenase
MMPGRRFAVFGHPVAHSLSPAMHNANFRALGLDAVYERRDVVEADLAANLCDFRSGGVNCTLPLKRAAYDLCDRLDESARRLGAVNTLRFDAGGGLTGFNTDGSGFLRDLEESLGCSPAGRSVLVFGCGGAGRAIAITCACAGAGAVALANRTPERIRALAAELADLAPGVPVRAVAGDAQAWAAACREADLVVQCTSLGLHDGDRFPLGADAFHRGQKVYDLVYTTPVTPIMRAARAAGADTRNGLGMLVHQGAASFTIWTGLQADLGAMRAALAPSRGGESNPKEGKR